MDNQHVMAWRRRFAEEKGQAKIGSLSNFHILGVGFSVLPTCTRKKVPREIKAYDVRIFCSFCVFMITSLAFSIWWGWRWETWYFFFLHELESAAGYHSIIIFVIKMNGILKKLDANSTSPLIYEYYHFECGNGIIDGLWFYDYETFLSLWFRNTFPTHFKATFGLWHLFFFYGLSLISNRFLKWI